MEKQCRLIGVQIYTKRFSQLRVSRRIDFSSSTDERTAQGKLIDRYSRTNHPGRTREFTRPLVDYRLKQKTNWISLPVARWSKRWRNSARIPRSINELGMRTN